MQSGARTVQGSRQAPTPAPACCRAGARGSFHSRQRRGDVAMHADERYAYIMETQERHDRVGEPGELESSSRPEAISALSEVDPEESVFAVLAARARTHSRLHLLATTIIGAVDAVALGVAHPALWPLATLFAAAG